MVVNPYYVLITNLGRKKNKKAASTSPWTVFMMPKLAIFSACMNYIQYQINLKNNLLNL